MTYDIYVGIDVSKAKFDVSWVDAAGNKPKSKAHSKTFSNDAKGFDVFSRWLVKQTSKKVGTCLVVMEATGIYHENLAYALHGLGFAVSVINPAYAKKFAAALGSHNKTDKQDAKILARYAQMQQPRLWQPAPEYVRYLNQLLARLDALEKDQRRESNRLEKLTATEHDAFVKTSIEDMLVSIETAITKIKNQIDQHIDNHPDLKQSYDNLTSVPGIGEATAPKLLALFKAKTFDNAAQCAAFIGLTPIQKQSGIFKGKSRMSKKGNSKIRAALYMPAVVAIQHNPDIKAQYQRLLATGKCRMAAVIAAMRKLLQICYGVIKHNSKYQPQISLIAA